MTELHVAGTGSFAAEIAAWARDAGFAVAALLEMLDETRVGSRVHGLPVVAARPPVPGRSAAVVGMGGDRPRLVARLTELGWRAQHVIHPTAHLDSSVSVAAGAVVGPRVVIGAASAIGPHALLGRGALVGHHTTVGAATTLNPGVNVAGNCTLGDGAFLGMGAVVVPGVTIGASAVVGAAALVLRDVPPGARVQGVPAVPFGQSR